MLASDKNIGDAEDVEYTIVIDDSGSASTTQYFSLGLTTGFIVTNASLVTVGELIFCFEISFSPKRCCIASTGLCFSNNWQNLSLKKDRICTSPNSPSELRVSFYNLQESSEWTRTALILHLYHAGKTEVALRVGLQVASYITWNPHLHIRPIGRKLTINKMTKWQTKE